jgi:hypothetical protein
MLRRQQRGRHVARMKGTSSSVGAQTIVSELLGLTHSWPAVSHSFGMMSSSMKNRTMFVSGLMGILERNDPSGTILLDLSVVEKTLLEWHRYILWRWYALRWEIAQRAYLSNGGNSSESRAAAYCVLPFRMSNVGVIIRCWRGHLATTILLWLIIRVE